MTKPSWLFVAAAAAAVDSPLFNLNQRDIELYTGSRRCCCKFFYYHHQLLGFLADYTVTFGCVFSVFKSH